MLQFGGILSHTTRFAQSRTTWWLTTQQILSSAACSSNPVALPKKQKEAKLKSISESTEDIKNKHNLVKLAFQNLSEKNDTNLAVKGHVISSKKMERADNEEVELSQFVSDKRFMNLLDKLSESASNPLFSLQSQKKNLDLLSLVTASRNMTQVDRYIMILSVLIKEKYRNVAILNFVSQKIITTNKILSIKQAADILYCMAILNFPHQELMNKISSDLLVTIPNCENQVLIGSILTSLGMLWYKDSILLDELSAWTVKYWSSMRPQDITALLMTLATVNYIPKNWSKLFKEHVLLLKKEDMVKLEQWLDIVWSLVVLNHATPEHVSSVFNKSFIDALMATELATTKKLKLLNINAVAKLEYKDLYSGPLLKDESEIFHVNLMNTKDKLQFIKAIIDPLKTLLPSSIVINTNIDTHMGFLLDIECIVDEDCCRLLSTNTAKHLKEPLKLAIMPQGYHEFTRGEKNLLGLISLQYKLLELKGYKVMQIPYTEYNIQNKLIVRLKYLSQRITAIVQECFK